MAETLVPGAGVPANLGAIDWRSKEVVTLKYPALAGASSSLLGQVSSGGADGESSERVFKVPRYLEQLIRMGGHQRQAEASGSVGRMELNLTPYTPVFTNHPLRRASRARDGHLILEKALGRPPSIDYRENVSVDGFNMIHVLISPTDRTAQTPGKSGSWDPINPSEKVTQAKFALKNAINGLPNFSIRYIQYLEPGDPAVYTIEALLAMLRPEAQKNSFRKEESEPVPVTEDDVVLLHKNDPDPLMQDAWNVMLVQEDFNDLRNSIRSWPGVFGDGVDINVIYLLCNRETMVFELGPA
ncbi:hypothetical protein ABW19_dt0203346 [Dactylella cylindrospora]|nr:hypothetical protein ABW19_dt0203346 [Dactylella cylindrospora]